MVIFGKLLNPFSSDDKATEENANIEVRSSSVPACDVPIEHIKKEDSNLEQASTNISDIGILEESVRELILDSVAPYTGKDDFVGIVIWVNDQIFHAINNEIFKTGLKAAFDSMHLYSLGASEINVIHGEPESQDEASPLIKKGIIPQGKLWFRLIEKGKELKHAKASISIFQELGSCKENEYILSSEDKSIYRIGRGAISRKHSSAYRVNDIIIEENNPHESIQKLNNHVSSAQADIILDDGQFFLRATPHGCRSQGGSPTKIIRNQEAVELRDSVSSYKLKDGDIIELGKSVLLLFKIVE